jgi:hypothetical protein
MAQNCGWQIKADGSLGEKYLVAGGVDESIFQPEWSPDGVLYFVSDKSNWWNFYRWQSRTPLNPPLVRGEAEIETSLCEMAAEFGLPQWVFGMSTYAVVSESKIICTYTQQGLWYLASLDLTTKHLTTIDTPYTDISSVKARGETVVFLGSSPTESTAIVQLNLATSPTRNFAQIEQFKHQSGLSFCTGTDRVSHGKQFDCFRFLLSPEKSRFRSTCG